MKIEAFSTLNRAARRRDSGEIAARFVNAKVPVKRASIELDNVGVIVAMVSAVLGVSVLQMADTSVCAAYPLRQLSLGRGAPRMKMSLVTRKADSDDRRLIALEAAMDATLTSDERRRHLALWPG